MSLPFCKFAPNKSKMHQSCLVGMTNSFTVLVQGSPKPMYPRYNRSWRRRVGGSGMPTARLADLLCMQLEGQLLGTSRPLPQPLPSRTGARTLLGITQTNVDKIII